VVPEDGPAIKDGLRLFPGRELMGNAATVAPAPQHLRALEQANHVRLARAELKRRIASQELSAAEVVLMCPHEANGMSISDVLMSQRRWGRARCRRLLLSLHLPENKQLGTLTQRQKLALAAVITAKTPVQPPPAPAQEALRVHEPALSPA
jgi:hypothetical protein